MATAVEEDHSEQMEVDPDPEEPMEVEDENPTKSMDILFCQKCLELSLCPELLKLTY